jgi:DNA-binding NtrC family response regulator
LTPRHLLLLDSDPAAQANLAGLLKRDDRQIEEVSDSREALDRIRAGPVDVILAGSANNGFDPLKLLRRVRSIRPETKVILTGEATPQNIIQAIRQRAFSYFHVPVPTVPLLEMVQTAIDADTWQDDIRVISARPEWITLDVRCKIEAADRTTHFLREIQERRTIPANALELR